MLYLEKTYSDTDRWEQSSRRSGIKAANASSRRWEEAGGLTSCDSRGSEAGVDGPGGDGGGAIARFRKCGRRPKVQKGNES